LNQRSPALSKPHLDPPRTINPEIGLSNYQFRSLTINELRLDRKMQEGEFDLNPFAVVDEAARLLPPV
jgi:hypothetical protein